MTDVANMIAELYKFSKGHLDIKKPCRVFLRQDKLNAQDLYGRTAQYEPHRQAITIFVTERHPKDILRSFAHELIHHEQHLRGEFDNDDGVTGEGYAQKNPHLRKMEAEAYERGNLLLRDFEASKKNGEKNTMLNEQRDRNKILTSQLVKRFGLTLNESQTSLREELDLGLKNIQEALKQELTLESLDEMLEQLHQLKESSKDSSLGGITQKLEELRNHMEEARIKSHKEDPKWTDYKQEAGPGPLTSPPVKKWEQKKEKEEKY